MQTNVTLLIYCKVIYSSLLRQVDEFDENYELLQKLLVHQYNSRRISWP